MEKEKGGFFEQIQGKINPVAVKYYYGPRMEKSDRSFPYLVQVMEAHVLMLEKQRIIPKKAAVELISVMEKWGREVPELDPSLEDLYINLEHLMTQEAGTEICSYLPVARSRNDVEASMWRIELREKMYDLADGVLDLVKILHKRAEETRDYIFPGYTYGQQAQPVSMGFHLLGYAACLLRHVERILECVERFNKNPLGAAAMSGTEYPIDREYTAKLLGFDGVWEHTADAVVSEDYMLEAANIGVMILTALARQAEDIINWCSNEAGFADLPDDLIDSSSIMPQKRNPVICATVRSQARLMAGRYAGISTACSVEFQASRDMTAAWEDVVECVNTADGMSRIAGEYIKGLKFRKENMEQVLYKGFSNATELADSLVLEGGLSFRQAHKIVGGAVSELFYQNKNQEDLTWELLDKWCREICAISLPMTKEQMEKAKDFRVAVNRRNCQGGSSPDQADKMLEHQQAETKHLEEEIKHGRGQWKHAEEFLHEEAEKLIQMGIDTKGSRGGCI